MSLYDELYCDVALPDREFPVGACFQTRSFPYPFLYRYRITAAGRLINSNLQDLEIDGYVVFRAVHEAPASALDCFEYRARFVDGQQRNIVRLSGPDGRLYGVASIRWFDPPPDHFFFTDEFGASL